MGLCCCQSYLAIAIGSLDTNAPAIGKILGATSAGIVVEALCWSTSASSVIAAGPAETISISLEVSSRIWVLLGEGFTGEILQGRRSLLPRLFVMQLAALPGRS